MSTNTLRSKRILIGATGSVATIKLPLLIQELETLFNEELEIKLVLTESAMHFTKNLDLSHVEILTDSMEWQSWKRISDPILHIELRNWADILLIAPLDANTLAKISHGLCDNLLTCLIRAWDLSKPVIVCPAMNTLMWQSPFTQPQLQILKDTLKFIVLDPISKKLACGDTGMGAMREPKEIALYLYDLFSKKE